MASYAQKSWSIYNFLILCRICIAPFLTGYIHPDEFFQGGQELWFGCPPMKTWEFEPENALRSVVPPTIMTWLPLQVCAKVLGMDIDDLPGWYIWIIPRVACAIFSVIAVDTSLWAICTENNKRTFNNDANNHQAVPLAVMLVASAWPTMTLLSRPFTNAMETWCLAILLRIALSNHTNHGKSKAKVSETTSITLLQCLLFGIIVGIGIFTRFTFVCFSIPIVLYFGLRMMRELTWTGTFVKVCAIYFAFLYVTGEMIDHDTSFYGLAKQDNSIVVTPWNAFSYNSKVENLQDHGLHPLWTHSLVNMFLLFGPMAVIVYASIWRNLWSSPLVYLSRAVLLFGLGVLSSVPHQEPRFLLPLLVPLSLLMENEWICINNQYKKCFVYAWLIFNGALLLFFGFLHQGGVIPSLLQVKTLLSSESSSHISPIMFYHTYMPPTFLAHERGGCRTNTTIIDLDGSHDFLSIKGTLLKNMKCDSNEDGGHSKILLVSSPAMGRVGQDLWSWNDEYCNISGYACKNIWRYGSHLSTEDPPPLPTVFKGTLPLNIYEISCL